MVVKSLLVPLDGSPESHKALPWALELAGKHQAEIILLRVGREPDILEGQDLTSLEAFMTKQEELCRDYLLRVKTDLKAEAYVKIRVSYGFGHASRVIAEKAAELGASMIVMNSHGRDGLSRWWMGSVAEKVTRHAPCPVLLVREAIADQKKGKAREKQAQTAR